jgi:thiol-disulfide isomerase/thioredoxin
MRLMSRRVATALLAGATLTPAAFLRKPLAQTILAPNPDPEIELRGIDAIKLADPPAKLAEQPFVDADGKPVSLASFLGKGLVINLWATWCTPCVAEMPALDRFAAAVRNDGIAVLPLSSDRGGAAQVRRFYEVHNIAHLDIWLDKAGIAAQGWGAQGLPTSIVVDRQGRERGRLEGGIAWDSDAAIAEIRRLVG